MVKGPVGGQLKLFMTPDELKSQAVPGDLSEIETAKSMWGLHHSDMDHGSYRRDAFGNHYPVHADEDSPDDVYPQNVRKDWKGGT